MRNIFFSISLISCVFATSLVYDPYSATDESPIDVNLDTYLNYVTDSLIRKQEVRDRLKELQKPADEFHIDGTAGTITKTTYDSQQNPTTVIHNVVPIGSVGTEYNSYNTKLNLPTLGGAAWDILAGDYSYQSWDGSWSWTSAQGSYNYNNALYAIYRNTLNAKQQIVQTNEHLTAANIISDKSLLLQNQQFKLQSDGLNESFKQTNALNEIKAQIQTGNVLAAANLGVGDTINSNLNSINNRLAASNLYAHEQNSKLDTTNGLLTDIKDTLNSGGEFTGFDTSGVNPDSDSILDGVASFFDHLEDDLRELTSDVTSIKTEFYNLLNLVDGSGLPTAINISSDSTACNLSFSFRGSTVRPLERLPAILAQYSAVFSLLVYVSVMILNFKFLFRMFSLRG